MRTARIASSAQLHCFIVKETALAKAGYVPKRKRPLEKESGCVVIEDRFSATRNCAACDRGVFGRGSCFLQLALQL
jgi:hypothetical protein